MSHTLGPWTVEYPMEFELAIVEANKPTYEWRFIATIDHGGDNFPTHVAVANARLIAAAPDLLSAAKAIAAAPYGLALGDLEQLNAAIAKAEGA